MLKVTLKSRIAQWASEGIGVSGITDLLMQENPNENRLKIYRKVSVYLAILKRQK